MLENLLIKFKSRLINENGNNILSNITKFIPSKINKYYTAVNQNNTDYDCIDGMFPRVYKQNATDIELTMFNSINGYSIIDAEYLDNVVDKFIRVITIDVDESKRFQRRNDREEIRRRLAMGAEDDYFSKIVNADRPGRKPSLHSRLQSGMNLQICFMNEASSDTESPSSDSETCPKLSKAITHKNHTNYNNNHHFNNSISTRYNNSTSFNSGHPYNSRPLSVNISSSSTSSSFSSATNIINNNRKSLTSQQQNRPSTLSLGPPVIDATDIGESDFFTKQARLQIEARMALAQAKDMAHMQMEIERQKQKQSPITEIIRNSLEKVGVPFPPEKRRVSRQMLTDMNIAQLQIIVNELHTQIEKLNEKLVQYLMERDDLHMSQDSMLVDIEDLTRYLGAKEQSKADEKLNQNTLLTNNTQQLKQLSGITTKSEQKSSMQQQQIHQSKFQRIASLVKK